MISNYKKYLDIGTNEGLRCEDESRSRFVSFSKCIDYLITKTNPTILEIGTSRSFVDGKFEGCNLDDLKYWNSKDYSKWDWGAGCFTIVFGQELPNSNLTTLDIIGGHIDRCKIMCQSLGLKNINYRISDSVQFLTQTNLKFDLIYLDSGDMHPIEPTCELQLQESKLIVEKNLLNKGGLLLIDDVLNGTPKEMGNKNNKLGKSELSIPFLISNGFKITYEGYQYILERA